MARHIFISSRGEFLPRWQDAFPDAVLRLPGSTSVEQVTHVWVRLESGQPVDGQLQAALRMAPGAAVLVLSDIPDDEEGLTVFAVGARAYANTHSTSEILQQMADVVSQGGLWIGQSLMQRLLTATSRMGCFDNMSC